MRRELLAEIDLALAGRQPAREPSGRSPAA
jgi:hypothetical protein